MTQDDIHRAAREFRAIANLLSGTTPWIEHAKIKAEDYASYFEGLEALASHAPSEAAAQPVLCCSKCGCELQPKDNFMEDMYNCPQCFSVCKKVEAAAQPDGYCGKAPTAPHPQYKDCVNWTPESEAATCQHCGAEYEEFHMCPDTQETIEHNDH